MQIRLIIVHKIAISLRFIREYLSTISLQMRLMRESS